MEEEEEEIKCLGCGSTSTATKSWYGRAPNHYCHKRGCIREGVEAGHIILRSNQQGPRSAGDGREFTEEMELLELEMIAATRFFKAGALRGEVKNGNKVPADARVLYLLIYGKFLRDLDDEKGCWGHFWMTAEQLRAQEKISDDARKEARDAYRDAEDALWVEGE